MLSVSDQTQRVQSTDTAPGSAMRKIDMSNVASVILAGGRGTRLFPLTESRCKPAIGFGGYYRLVDIPLSNAINSGCRRIYVVTQFLSSSLHRHIFRTYSPETFSSGFIEILTAEQKPTKETWYQGTADAIRQNIDYIADTPVDYFLVLSGDQLYHMDFGPMLEVAKETGADCVIASLPVEEHSARRMGLLKVNRTGLICDFIEKPQEPEILKKFACPQPILEKLCRSEGESPYFLGSMGIYLFKKKALLKLLEEDTREDFGKHLIPTIVQQGGAYAYLFDGYWEDIGTIECFYNANIALTRSEPPFSCYEEGNPLYSERQHLPPAKIVQCKVSHSIICNGAVVEADEVTNSIIGPRSVIRQGTVIQDSYLMGNDYYNPPLTYAKTVKESPQIGRHCVIKRAIIDSNVRLGDGVQLINRANLDDYDSENVFIRHGIIVVKRGTCLPDGFIL